MTPPLILASTSSSRRMMLDAAGVTFSAVAPNVDETMLQQSLTRDGAGPGLVAERLAEAKATAVSENFPGALVLGGDQVLVCGNHIFNKAVDASEARKTLLALNGADHELISAAVLARGGKPVWRHTDTARLRMRNFSDAFLDEYLAAELPDILGSVGCYRIEGRGAQLFASIEGDQFCIRGLPLIAVLEALRQFGALVR